MAFIFGVIPMILLAPFAAVIEAALNILEKVFPFIANLI